jgi:hypothetical protein
MASLSRLETVTAACPAKGSAPPVSAVELLGESGVYLASVIWIEETTAFFLRFRARCYGLHSLQQEPRAKGGESRP